MSRPTGRQQRTASTTRPIAKAGSTCRTNPSPREPAIPSLPPGCALTASGHGRAPVVGLLAPAGPPLLGQADGQPQKEQLRRSPVGGQRHVVDVTNPQERGDEIGRASCRGGAESWGGAVPGEESERRP